MSDFRNTANQLALMLAAFRMDPRTREAINKAKRELCEAADALEALRAENERLRDILQAIEMMTATGDGLDPDATIEIHIIAAEGRSDDPCAWRADPEAINRLRAALKGDDNA